MKSLYDKLYIFQKKIVDLYHDRSRLGLFLDMGLGKTITSLALCEKNEVDGIIVVSTKSKSEETIEDKGSFDYHLHEMGFKIFKKDKYNKLEIKSDEFTDKDAIVINYESFVTRDKDIPQYLLDFLKHYRYKKIAVILDESHKVKNSSSQRSKSIKKFISLCNITSTLYLYLLTGTPFTQGFIDLHNQLSLLGCSMTRTTFIDTFCIRGHIPGLYEWQQPIIGYKNKDELYYLISKYAISELTENNIKLPEQIFYDIRLPETLEFQLLINQKISEKILNDYLIKYKNDKTVKKTMNLTKVMNPFFRNFSYPDDKFFADTSANFWLRARQLSVGFQGNETNYEWYNLDRINKLKELLENNRENYVIFYNYTPELGKIFEVCEELDYDIDVYCGDIKELNHYEKFETMNDDKKMNDKKKVIIANFMSGSEGKNWQEYNHVIFFSLPLYGSYAQALKRCHRIGQDKTVYYYTFYQNNFLDTGMKEALEENKTYNDEMFTYELEKRQF